MQIDFVEYFSEADSEAGSYFKLIDFVHHSTLSLREIKKKKKCFFTSDSDNFRRRVCTMAGDDLAHKKHPPPRTLQ